MSEDDLQKRLDQIDPDGLMQWIMISTWVNAGDYLRWSDRDKPGADVERDRQRRNAAALKAEEKLGKCPTKLRKAAREQWIEFGSAVYAQMIAIESAGGWRLHDEQDGIRQHLDKQPK